MSFIAGVATGAVGVVVLWYAVAKLWTDSTGN